MTLDDDSVRDYFYVAVDPTQNYGVRKVLAREGVDQDVVASLLERTLEEGKDLVALGADVITETIQKSMKVKEILRRNL